MPNGSMDQKAGEHPATVRELEALISKHLERINRAHPRSALQAVNARGIEILKVYYAMFSTLMETEPEKTLLQKLKLLRRRLEEEIDK
jgi:hypothetical protein